MSGNSIFQQLMRNQIFRFVISAGTGFLVDIIAYYVLYNFVFTAHSYQIINHSVSNYLLSLIISFFMGVLVNFLINRFLVFSESTLAPYKQAIRFFSVAIIGFFANMLVLKFMVTIVHLYPPVARIAAALSLFFASFFVHKLFSFNLKLRPNAGENN
ncbi:GtrA family protein [Mucilaginibacter sp. RS28]|uniref:GtrA family protein n=1 Tax=Mucilaginibacter straminoryzae TaxID=2932774 RepID=A0A9X1X4Y1_9SPHI|nr:GtrA family protein [Mucilaginibacter straminoryzae]MCJ8209668.1 GtrA family protein [Mucilaginibacter straminoryzae]